MSIPSWTHELTATWIKGRPAFWVRGVRVSREKGFEFAKKQQIDLPNKFMEWKAENEQ